MQDTTDRPDIEETYTAAVSASNLRLETREGSATGAAGLLIAVGWSESRVGAIFMRLHSEWDGSAKPLRPTPEAIRQLAKRADAADIGKSKLTPDQWAHQEANRWYEHEVRILLLRLKSLPQARAAVADQADKWKIYKPHSVAGAVVKYWLDQTCPACHGLRWQKNQNAPVLGNRVCQVCRGQGISQAPFGMEGRRLLNYIDDCVNRARSSIKSRLGAMHKPVAK